MTVSGGAANRMPHRPVPEQTVVQVACGLRVKRVAMARVNPEMVEPRPAQTESDQRNKASDEARQINIQADARFLASLF
jgi:hypothetical protein